MDPQNLVAASWYTERPEVPYTRSTLSRGSFQWCQSVYRDPCVRPVHSAPPLIVLSL